LNILFLASSDFAILPLKMLYYETPHKITLITKKDKPKGRGLRISPSPLVLTAEKLGIKVFQENDIFPIISSILPELIVVVAYGRFLSGDILKIPKYGCINLHPSLLPKYRGAAPIAWALINGEEKTGVSIFFINETMDGGDIILQREVAILEDDNYESLFLRLSEIGGGALIDAISLIEKGKVERKPQEGIPTFAPKIKEAFEISLDWEAKKILNLIRGVPKDPGVWINLFGERIKVLKARLFKREVEKGGIIIGCKNGSIILDIVQKQGKRPIKGSEFLCGIRKGRG